MQQYRSNSYLFGGNAPYVEELYEAYLDNPGSVPDNWRAYFDRLQNVAAVDGSEARDVAHAPVVESFAQRAKANAFALKASDADLAVARKQVHVQSLVAAYRFLGSRWADLDPLKRTERPKIPELEPAFYDLSESDMDITFSAVNTYFSKAENMTLREIMQALRETYCGTIGAEFMHCVDPAEKRWWQERLESIRSKPNFTAAEKVHILDRLTAAEGLERYLHTKYVGQKRFSLEGGESFIASMDEVVQRAGERGVQEIVIGMAHRGRLNVLVNILGKQPKDMFAEFDHTAPEDLPSGDVKYHQGFSSDVSTAGGPVHLSLAFNPSHLEIVNPVVEGSVKARMDRRGDKEGDQVLPVLVHGDAAFAGQGVVMETLALAQTRGYYTGGTVHLVINNQIGFTTSDPRDTRSTLYCTDVVKMIEAPVLHVNGDDPEAVVLCTQLALDYRQTFNKDVVVDIVCFRKLGHNEQDTPSLTQPLMYKKIAQHPGHAQAVRREAGGPGRAAGGRPGSHGQGTACRARRRQAHRRSGADQLQEQVRGRLGAVPQPQVDRCRRHGAAAGRDQAPGRAHHHRAGQLQGAPAGREGAGRPRRDGPRRDQCRLGHGRAPGLSPRWWPAAMRCACRARTAAAAPSPTAMRCCTTRTARSGTPASTCRCRTWPTTRRRSSSSTRCCPRRRCWPSSTATPAPSRTRWSSGRRSSATSSTARRWSSTSSSPRAKSSGAVSTA